MPFTTILSQNNKLIAKTWGEIERFANDQDPERKTTEWIFRGQDCEEPPKTVLERTIKDLDLPIKDTFIFEYVLIDRFIRNIYTIDPSIPKNLTTVELLALMRHYGAPSRLIDFTYSFYLAVFFAMENLEGEFAVVWAIDAIWLQDRARKYLGLDGKDFMPGKYEKDFKKYFIYDDGEDFKSIVYQITPDLLNQRISIQQGTFLCPSDVRLPFEKNLAAIMTSEDLQTIDSHIKLLRISRAARKPVLKKLGYMNISRASLFPGLDGFAQSIKTALLFPSTIKVYREKRRDVFEREKHEQTSLSCGANGGSDHPRGMNTQQKTCKMRDKKALKPPFHP